MTAPTWQSAKQQSEAPRYQYGQFELQQGHRQRSETQNFRRDDQSYNRG